MQLYRYRTLLNRTYVDDNTSMTWCPAPNCEYAIQCSVPQRSLDVVLPTVSCVCGHVFCFGCGLDGDHRPCCCPVVRKWVKKCKDDSETSNWISANTKECTKCHSTIEKNGGCNVSLLLPSYLILPDTDKGNESVTAHDLQEMSLGKFSFSSLFSFRFSHFSDFGIFRSLPIE